MVMGLRENMINKGVFIMLRWLEKFVSDLNEFGELRLRIIYFFLVFY